MPYWISDSEIQGLRPVPHMDHHTSKQETPASSQGSSKSTHSASPSQAKNEESLPLMINIKNIVFIIYAKTILQVDQDKELVEAICSFSAGIHHERVFVIILKPENFWQIDELFEAIKEEKLQGIQIERLSMYFRSHGSLGAMGKMQVGTLGSSTVSWKVFPLLVKICEEWEFQYLLVFKAACCSGRLARDISNHSMSGKKVEVITSCLEDQDSVISPYLDTAKDGTHKISYYNVFPQTIFKALFATKELDSRMDRDSCLSTLELFSTLQRMGEVANKHELYSQSLRNVVYNIELGYKKSDQFIRLPWQTVEYRRQTLKTLVETRFENVTFLDVVDDVLYETPFKDMNLDFDPYAALEPVVETSASIPMFNDTVALKELNLKLHNEKKAQEDTSVAAQDFQSASLELHRAKVLIKPVHAQTPSRSKKRKAESEELPDDDVQNASAKKHRNITNTPKKMASDVADQMGEMKLGGEGLKNTHESPMKASTSPSPIAASLSEDDDEKVLAICSQFLPPQKHQMSESRLTLKGKKTNQYVICKRPDCSRRLIFPGNKLTWGRDSELRNKNIGRANEALSEGGYGDTYYCVFCPDACYCTKLKPCGR